MVILVLLAWGQRVQAETVTFPIPEVLRPNVIFWKRIFTAMDSRSGLLHDTTDVSIIYHTLRDLPRDRQQRQRLVDRYRHQYQRILRKLAKGKRRHLSPNEKRVLALFKGKQTPSTLMAAVQNIRFQRGLRSRFARGLARSGAYMPTIRQIFTEAGLPVELGVLPHVESSFNTRAYSKSGAAGIWQFIRSTGRRFLRIDRLIDERLDFRHATLAAAKLLRRNYQKLGTWPLAITAYNHGANGMKRAVDRLKTRDFGTIVQHYKSRTFGFASKNFYAEFLAALHVVKRHQTYFPKVTINASSAYHVLQLDAYIALQTLAQYLRVEPREIAHWNPALRQPILSGQRLIPRHSNLYIPAERMSVANLQARWKSIPAAMKFAAQRREKKYRVRWGDTLSVLARRYRTTVATLMKLNNIDHPKRLKAGQWLKLP